MNDKPVIHTRGLTRYFGGRPAVYDLSLEVPRGSVFAFLGRNGSGKTTTIRMLLGLMEPTRGSSTILGHDSQHLPPEVRTRIESHDFLFLAFAGGRRTSRRSYWHSRSQCAPCLLLD